jgi:hypothetical protein
MKKLFKFPTPKELGMSNFDFGMPSRLFPNHPMEYTWEDYEERLQEMYPDKYLLAYTLPKFFLHLWWAISRPLIKVYYWFVSHFVPSRRYHWLDLRQPDYKYGWLDIDARMVYALFNLLSQFVEKESHQNYIPTEEEVKECHWMKESLDNYKEYMGIYNWWKIDRAKGLEEESKKLTEWSLLREQKDKADKILWDNLYRIHSKEESMMRYDSSEERIKREQNERSLFAELKALQIWNENKLEEMLHRLINIRHVLWS